MNSYKFKLEQKTFKYQPSVNIFMYVANEGVGALIESIDSVLGQLYEEWELNILLATSGEEQEKILTNYTKEHRKIKISLVRNGESESSAINDLIKRNKCDYVAFLGQEDILWPDTLHQTVKTLNENKSIDLIYTDEDQIPDDRHDHIAPFLKPDWNPVLLESMNYIQSFLVVKSSLYKRVGGLDAGVGSALWWDLSFRLANAATNIYHIPKVLYSKRLHLDKSKECVENITVSERNVLKKHIEQSSDEAVLEKNNEIWKVARLPKDDLFVSIVIPTKNQYSILKKCIASIYKKTLYKKFEIILVDTGSTSNKVLRLYRKLLARHDNIKVVEWREEVFSYSRSCNEGARHAKGEVLIMLNNDTEVLSSNWLDRLVAEVQLPGVGAVGPLLTYPDGVTVQHAGVGVGLGGAAANLLAGLNTEDSLTRSQYIMLHARRNVSALTGACMAIRREVFEKIGGFDESFRITYNDVDLCLRLLGAGYKNIYIPDVQLIHHESISLGLPEESTVRDNDEFRESMDKLRRRWGEFIAHDPHLNGAIDKTNSMYRL